MEAFYQNTVSLVQAIEDCIEKRRILPCLTLLYTGIDVIASLERKPNEGTKTAFLRWVDEYVLSKRALPCTALELYAARCGILHTFTADSDLSQARHVRKLTYAWGTAEARGLEITARILGREDLVVIHIRDLIDAFRHGLADYLEEVSLNSQRQATVQRQASLWFVHIDKDLVNEFLKIHADEDPT